MTEPTEDQMETRSIAKTEFPPLDGGAERTERNFLEQALEIQGELIKLFHNREIKTTLQQKMQTNQTRMMKVVLLQSQEIARLQGRLEVAEQAQTTTPTTQNYADSGLMKKTAQRPLRNRSRSRRRFTHAVIVKPREEQPSEATLHDLKRNVDPSEMNVTIERVKKINNGGVVISTSTAEDAKKLKEKLQAAEVFGNYAINLPKLRCPQMVIYGVSEEIRRAELKQLIIENNTNIEEDEFQIWHNYSTCNGRNWIVELKPTLIEKLENRKIRIDWQRYNYKELLRPTMCFNCGRFGHIGRHCRSKTRCLKCGDEIHLRKDCPAQVATCINCQEHKRHKTHSEIQHYCMQIATIVLQIATTAEAGTVRRSF